MAKKNEDKLSYLQMPLPKGRKKGKITKTNWSGLNYRNTKDTGELSKELNISTNFAPCLTPSYKKRIVKESVFDSRASVNTDGSLYITEASENVNAKDIKYYEGYFIVQGVYEDEVETSDGGTENVLNNLYQIYDKGFNLMYSTHIEKIPGDYCGSGIVEFRYFENFNNITSISAGSRLIYLPRGTEDKKSVAYSQQLPEVVPLKRRFNYRCGNNSGADETIGRYLDENSTRDGVYYLFEFATDEDENGNPLFPGGESYNSSNSIWVRVRNIYERPGSPSYTHYFNKKQPYLLKAGGLTKIEPRECVVPGKPATITIMPDIYYACTAHQRLFGINNECVYASGFNNYANWNLDTANSYSAENAWMSSTQSSDGGNNVGIIAYGGSVFVFKKNSTFEIINTKNPFRINEVFNVGSISQKGIQVVGNYLIFVSEDTVNLYNGSSLRDIGYKLNINSVEEVVTGTDDRRFYMFCRINKSDESRLFVYDTDTGLWSEEEVGTEEVKTTRPVLDDEGNEQKDENGNVVLEEIAEDQYIEYVGFVKSDTGFYGLSSAGRVYRLDTNDYNHDWYVETDFFTNNSIDIKHISRVQMLLDMAPESKVAVYILYDDEEFSPDASHKIFEKTNTEGKEIKLPVRVIPKKTANYGFKIRIEGEGFAKIYQMELEITGGGEKLISG